MNIDEFNEELNNLLSDTQHKPAESAPKASTEKQTGSAPQPAPEKATAAQVPEPPVLKYGPAPQPSAPASSDAAADEPPGTPTAPMEKSQPAYAVLKEIDPSERRKNGSGQKAKQKRTKKAGIGRFVKVTAVAAIALSTAGLVYWGMGRWHHRVPPQQASITELPAERSSSEPNVPAGATDPASNPAPQPLPVANSDPSPVSPAPAPLGSLKSDLASARKQVGDKIEELINLTAYYHEGIQEEQKKIRATLQDNPVPSLEKALADNQIELSIRAIQRRHAYISKLGAPLEQLKASSEELLYLERRTQIFETLSQWVSVPSMPQYRQQIADRIRAHLKIIKELSVDNTRMDLPSKAAIWDEVVAELKRENALAAQLSKTYAQDKLIGQEICSGEYGRKYLLAHLSEETATCLIRWSGKDLYLNGLSELSPQAAQILARWPGEWISLNGIKEISAETARYLAQWPGKRLSLNGLEKLSPQATAELSRWKGEQLEMIGLTSIGPWENYATRLYLSETMRRKLQM